MSGIARIMLARGVPVSGCDSAASSQLEELAALGAHVGVGHSADHLASADTLVVSSAIRRDNPELAAALGSGMPVLHRAAALASVMLGRQGIAVAGTHGKTTTTGMITTVLRRCGADPGYVIGGILAETGLGAGDTQISEIVQRDTMDVTPAGTTAAAATGIAVGTAESAAPPLTLTFNRPFLLLLEDTATHTPLFLAQVTNPAQQ